MLTRKPAILLCSFHGMQCAYNPSCPRQRAAHVRTHASACDSEHCFQWPASASHGRLPTPYEVLSLRRGAPYDKRAFYDLVKMYHPDRPLPAHVRSDDMCAGPIRLERYRLIVAAHAILSDPSKRAAYDRWGAGWGSARDVEGASCAREHGWKPGDDPFANATWEDWERWHNRHQKREQHPIFVSNGAFVGLVAVAAALGGYGQATRAGHWGDVMVSQRDTVHAATSRDLRRVRQAAMECGDREQRIQSFLRHREAATHGEDGYGKLLPYDEVPRSVPR